MAGAGIRGQALLQQARPAGLSGPTPKGARSCRRRVCAVDAPSPLLSGLEGKEDTRNEQRSRDGDDGAESGAGMRAAAEPPELRPGSRTREARAAGGQRPRTPRAKVGGLGLLLADTLFPAKMLWPRGLPQPPSAQCPASSVRDGGGRRWRRGTLGAQGPCQTGRSWKGHPPPCPSW